MVAERLRGRVRQTVVAGEGDVRIEVLSRLDRQEQRYEERAIADPTARRDYLPTASLYWSVLSSDRQDRKGQNRTDTKQETVGHKRAEADESRPGSGKGHSPTSDGPVKVMGSKGIRSDPLRRRCEQKHEARFWVTTPSTVSINNSQQHACKSCASHAQAAVMAAARSPQAGSLSP